jgi:hypothetical protein
MVLTQDRTATMTRRRRMKRQNVALFVLASLVGLWFGTSAPSTSPVTPPAPPSAVISTQTAVPPAVTTPPAADDQPVIVRGRNREPDGDL